MLKQGYVDKHEIRLCWKVNSIVSAYGTTVNPSLGTLNICPLPSHYGLQPISNNCDRQLLDLKWNIAKEAKSIEKLDNAWMKRTFQYGSY